MPQFARLLAVALLGAAGGAAALAAAAPHTAPADGDLQPAGKPISCITQSQIVDTHVVDDSTIDFVMPGHHVYRNHLAEPCPELAQEGSFTHATPTNSYCSGDLITVFRHTTPGFPGATCPLGEFQPMARASHAG